MVYNVYNELISASEQFYESYLSTYNKLVMKMTDSNEASLTVVPLHQHPELMKQCCELINDEWPRSETARMLSLKTSCDKMPTSLILLNSQKTVIGHCKLTPIPSIKDSCFVESVVISRLQRGKGLGSFLMKASEHYCQSKLSLSTIHLSTKGQEQFYEKLGYKVCEPISIYGSIQTQNVFQKIFTPNKVQNTSNFTPPAPPLPLTKGETSKQGSKTYMVKSILV